MKSKFFVFTCICAIILACASCSFASTVSANESVKNGENVVVTFDFGKPVTNGEFYVTYDASVLELVTETPELPGVIKIKASTPGNVGFIFAGTNAQAVSTFTLTFKVIGEAGKTATVALAPVAGEFKDAEGNIYEVATASKTVTVVAASDPGTTPEPDNKDDKDTSTNNNDKTPSTPNKYPQTGVNVAYVAAGILLAVAAGYVVVKKH